MVQVGVPEVWESIDKVNSVSPITKSIFNAAMYVLVLAQLADSFVLSKIGAATGGRLHIALSGGAAIGHDNRNFVYCAGHGMTVLQDDPST